MWLDLLWLNSETSIELLLSIIKAESFECRDARIRTHTLEFRNQTWSVCIDFHVA